MADECIKKYDLNKDGALTKEESKNLVMNVAQFIRDKNIETEEKKMSFMDPEEKAEQQKVVDDLKNESLEKEKERVLMHFDQDDDRKISRKELIKGF